MNRTESRAKLRAKIIELREAAYDYAHLIQVERFNVNDMAVHRAYDRLRNALGHPIGLDLPLLTDVKP